jgi:hypothetical protein
MQTDLCNGCKNYLGLLICLAFPDGIPDEILTGGNDHSKPLPGQDNDIVYEPREGAT